jgi:hypothetical protein
LNEIQFNQNQTETLFNTMRNFILSALFSSTALVFPLVAICGELYPSGEVRPYKQFEYMESDATAGGYPIFQGGRPWMIISAKTVRNNVDVGIGYAQFFSPLQKSYFAEMFLTTTLGGGSGSHTGYFTGEPCGTAVQALVKINKASGHSGRIQGRSATRLNEAWNTSWGVLNPSRFLGR